MEADRDDRKELREKGRAQDSAEAVGWGEGRTQVWGRGIKVTGEGQEVRVKGRNIGKDKSERRGESTGSARETYERAVGRQARR